MIVANPPYIAQDGAVAVDPEVTGFEPRVALYAGADGLDCYRALAPQAVRLLAPDGALFLEIGYSQATEVTAVLLENELQVVEIKEDLSGIPRCAVARRRRR